MLKRVMEWVHRRGFKVNNVDTTIVAQKPKLAPHIMTMKATLSEIMDIGSEQMSIKATTTEGLGFCGRQEGMEAYAVVSLILAEPGK
jgi:2-C-methyl-D-erythritol 2,4-cyclodiphosphate synthase